MEPEEFPAASTHIGSLAQFIGFQNLNATRSVRLKWNRLTLYCSWVSDRGKLFLDGFYFAVLLNGASLFLALVAGGEKAMVSELTKLLQSSGLR